MHILAFLRILSGKLTPAKEQNAAYSTAGCITCTQHWVTLTTGQLSSRPALQRDAVERGQRTGRPGKKMDGWQPYVTSTSVQLTITLDNRSAWYPGHTTPRCNMQRTIRNCNFAALLLLYLRFESHERHQLHTQRVRLFHAADCISSGCDVRPTRRPSFTTLSIRNSSELNHSAAAGTEIMMYRRKATGRFCQQQQH